MTETTPQARQDAPVYPRLSRAQNSQVLVALLAKFDANAGRLTCKHLAELCGRLAAEFTAIAPAVSAEMINRRLKTLLDAGALQFERVVTPNIPAPVVIAVQLANRELFVSGPRKKWRRAHRSTPEERTQRKTAILMALDARGGAVSHVTIFLKKVRREHPVKAPLGSWWSTLYSLRDDNIIRITAISKGQRRIEYTAAGRAGLKAAPNAQRPAKKAAAAAVKTIGEAPPEKIDRAWLVSRREQIRNELAALEGRRRELEAEAKRTDDFLAKYERLEQLVEKSLVKKA